MSAQLLYMVPDRGLNCAVNTVSSQTETYGRLHKASKAPLRFLQLTKEVQSGYQNTVAHFIGLETFFYMTGPSYSLISKSFHK